MISWWWALAALVIGMFSGILIVSLMAAGATETAYRAGYTEGHEKGFQDGISEWSKVG